MIRTAKVSDHWRTVNHGNSACFISEVECNVSGRDKKTITLEKGIVAFIGRNGARKTTLIRGIYQLLPSTKKNRQINIDRRNTLEIIDATFVSNSTSSSKISEGETPIEAFLFDPCSSVPELRSILQQDENMEDLFDIGEARDLTSAELDKLEYLTGNKYEKVVLVVVEDYNDEFPRFPLFRVQRSSLSYDSRDMGYGEFSILLFHWIIGQIHECREDGDNVVLFLEEPESFISPEYQKRLMSICAETVASCKCQALVVSHSEHIIGRIKHSKIQNIRWCDGDVEITTLARHSQVFEELGLVPSRKAMLFCEDNHSKILLRELLRSSSKFCMNEFLIEVKNGEGEVRNSLSHLPQILDGFRFIGVLDGDCRQQNWTGLKTCFLPGNYPPEILLIEWFKNQSLSKKAKLVNKSEADTLLILDRSNGIDHHEYFRSLAGGDYALAEIFYHSVCVEWINVNLALLEQFLREFEAHFA